MILDPVSSWVMSPAVMVGPVPSSITVLRLEAMIMLHRGEGDRNRVLIQACMRLHCAWCGYCGETRKNCGGALQVSKGVHACARIGINPKSPHRLTALLPPTASPSPCPPAWQAQAIRSCPLRLLRPLRDCTGDGTHRPFIFQNFGSFK